MKERERLASRLGFIFLSAGCAIGLGNVYRFPISTGSYGGALFVLIYIAFLLLLGIPIMTAELAVGRASRRSIATSFDVLEKTGQKWHFMKYLGISGNYLLMMFYCTIAGLMLVYFQKYLNGSILNAQGDAALKGVFDETISNPVLMLFCTFVVIVVCFLICSLGLQKGVENISKKMMVAMLSLIIGLVFYSLTLENAAEGLQFYLIPSFEKIQAEGITTVLSAAMGQALFTLSVGIGSIAVFGSYMEKSRRLLGEALTIVSLDTFVAFLSGLIIFPACFTYNNGITADAGTVGASFLFTTLSSIFNAMPTGRLLGSLFFLFMIFASVSTIVAVFENIISFWLEQTKLQRRTIALINIPIMTLLALPSALSLNIWSDVTVFGKSLMDLEDYIVSNLLLPFGSLLYLLFCTSRYGWGWKNFLSEVNAGEKGIRMPAWIRPYMTVVLPFIVLFVLIVSLL